MRLLIESQYLPPICYFSTLLHFDEVVVEKYEHYQKQTYRNRCYVNTSNGPDILIVPLTAKHGKVLIKDIRIDYSQKWLNGHWRTIQSAYGKAPFFEYYATDFHDILFQKHDFLYDLNFSLLTMCLKWLRYNIPVTETSIYEKAVNEDVIDFRSVINPKKEEGGNRFFKSVAYHQVFGSKFVNNLSIVDLVFCEGPGAMSIVRASATK
ncbi:MAG TPA: WbqC family protein [Chryseosolibacter sp.]|nr:WbqC family protein [Chryseosolibacter sp.]